MLLRVVDQQGIHVVRLYTNKERLRQLRRQHVGYTIKLFVPIFFTYSIERASTDVALQLP
jgi:hypothetical protein